MVKKYLKKRLEKRIFNFLFTVYSLYLLSKNINHERKTTIKIASNLRGKRTEVFTTSTFAQVF